MNGNNIVISAKNIYKTFGKGEAAQSVFEGASLDIEKGSFVSLMGESGSGKSTLLYLIGGLDRDFTGDIFVGEDNITQLNDAKLSEIRCKKIGFVFQFYNLAANLTVEDNILLPIEMSHRRIADYKEKYQEILSITGLESKVKSYPSQLSGGQQQRVSIGRAIVKNPDILLCDEPTGALDSATSRDILVLLEKINEKYGTTMLIVTHNNSIKNMVHKVIFLKDGVVKTEYLNETRVPACELEDL